ncbi:MAG: hypothetical protein LCI00_05730 [Chloroflexi bacterium]|nr:hypothetical protein [Chloroflexota bacterium]MCC6896495.1 hypothetical protein [Anaerolineae bacterium]
MIQSPASQAAWREDLNGLAEQMESRHPDLFWRVSETDFKVMVSDLDDKIPFLTNEQIIVEFARIVAIADAHSHLSLYQSGTGFSVYPLRLYFFRDGLFIVDAEAASLIGSQVTAINGHSIEEVYNQVAPIITHDNLHGMLNLAPSYLIGPQILHALGLINDVNQPNLALKLPDGSTSVINSPPVAAGDSGWEEWFMSMLPQREAPIYLSRHTDKNFWFTFLPDTKTLYIQYNWISSTNPDGESLVMLVKAIEQFLAENSINRTVLDLRHNAGGNNTTYSPLLRLLTQNEAINQPDRFYTLIGRRTFSAAANLVIELEQKSHTIFVGEPMGDTPNMYGDPIPFTLPNSKLVVAISSRFWEKSPDDTRDTVEPDIRIDLSSTDYFNLIDPVLEAVINLPA